MDLEKFFFKKRQKKLPVPLPRISFFFAYPSFASSR